MAHRLQKALIAVAGAAVAAMAAGALSASAAEVETETLSRFIVTDSGTRVLTGSASADAVTQGGWYVASDNSLYYYYSDGTHAQDETTLEDGYTYSFAADGALETGWQTVDKKRYYYHEETGQLVFGWVTYLDDLYYVDEEDGKLVGEQTVDGVRYAFDSYGCVKTGWVTFSDGKLFYYDKDANLVTGWKMKSGSTYYLTEKGALTGWQTINGKKYYFSGEGKMQTGLKTIGSDTYYFNPNTGAMRTGWVSVDGTSYYFDPNSGAMVNMGYVPIQLDVPSYKQFDSEWANTTITYSTIGKVGCLVTSIAMKYSYETETTVEPDEMLAFLTFSGDSLQWVSFSNLGYTMEQPSSSLTQSVMQKIYSCLKDGKPVIVGAKTSSGGQHYVVVTGYTGTTGSTLSSENFVIQDPGSSKRDTLDDLFVSYPLLYMIVY
ncbi:MAG: C39 family peptidase [Ruminococcus sp.]|nr:C39 family peptidase [Ruminococcus sp.]